MIIPPNRITLRDATFVTVMVPMLFEYDVDPLPEPTIPLKTQPKPSINIPLEIACWGGTPISKFVVNCFVFKCDTNYVLKYQLT